MLSTPLLSSATRTMMKLFCLMLVCVSEAEKVSWQECHYHAAVDCASEKCLCEDQDQVVLLQTNFEIFRDHLNTSNNSEAHVLQALQLKQPNATFAYGGIYENAEGDMAAFQSALLINIVMGLGCVALFCYLRIKFPIIYSYNVLTGVAPLTPAKNEDGSDTWFGWMFASYDVQVKEACVTIGLDHAMLLQFCNLCMKILGIMSVPLLLLLAPLHRFCGGNRAGADYLSWVGMGNVVDGSWLYYVHGVVVLGVSVLCIVSINRAMEKFMEVRFEWLYVLPAPRDNTIMIEGIPSKWQSDEQLKAYFNEALEGDVVEDAHTVKFTKSLLSLKAKSDKIQSYLDDAKARWEKAGSNEDARPTVWDSQKGERVDAIRFYEVQVADMETKVQEERNSILEKAAKQSGREGNHTSNAFVTFKERKKKELAMMIAFSSDRRLWRMSEPPPAADVIWSNLQSSDEQFQVMELLAYLACAGLYLAYMPMVVYVTNIAVTINLGPYLQPIWSGLAPTIGMELLLSFTPTLILLIFRMFFLLRADIVAQELLHRWYFFFQVVFIILVTAVGTSTFQFSQEIARSPFSIFTILAEALPTSTHYYLNFMVLQWATHAKILLRYVQLGKFLAARALYSDEKARDLAEPEDQDFFGMGSRSARFSINMLIGIIFSTLSPLLAVLTFINFAFCRLAYGWLLIFAECRKPDSGGVFYVNQLNQLFFGVALYCVLMIGVLLNRASDNIPGIMGVVALVITCKAWWDFRRFNGWDSIPYEMLMPANMQGLKERQTESAALRKALSSKSTQSLTRTEYVQPELSM